MKKLLFFLTVLFLGATVLYGQVDTSWVRRFDGTGHSTDIAYALALDDSQNIFVTGESSNGQDNDFCTLKYSPTGVLLWFKRYSAPGTSGDAARAVAVDRSRNIYVTGYSSSTNYDIATIRYNSAGDTVWVRRYNGPGNGDDYALALTLDVIGNVFVAGYATGSGTGFDFCLLKYAPNGNLLWNKIYQGGSGDDFARALIQDASGNVYVTGESYNGTNYDYLTLKYSSNGDSLWARRYNGSANGDDKPTAIAVDGSGNIMVTGRSWGSNFDFCTIKYNPNGDTLWIRRYNGPGNRADAANALTVDRWGNIFVSGGSDSITTDYRTIKYSSSGVFQWERSYDGPWTSVDEIKAQETDTAGNLYVTGYSDGGGFFFDYCTIKYSPGGNQLWLTRYNGPGNYADIPNALILDSVGNVYITGQSNGGSSVYDYCTIKYRQIPSKAFEEKNENPRRYEAWFANPAKGRLCLAIYGALGPSRVLIYDVAGRKVRELMGTEKEVVWDLRNRENREVNSGIYFLRIITANGEWTGKALVIK